MNIKEIRQSKGLTQVQLAELVGCTQKDISRWETGLVNASNETLSRLAEVLNVSLQELLEERNFIKEAKNAGHFCASKLKTGEVLVWKKKLIDSIKMNDRYEINVTLLNIFGETNTEYDFYYQLLADQEFDENSRNIVLAFTSAFIKTES